MWLVRPPAIGRAGGRALQFVIHLMDEIILLRKAFIVKRFMLKMIKNRSI
jgi:hypothetical protein